jgi:hypothetical protein
MSTTRKGLIVRYNQFDQLLISLEREDDFIVELESRLNN